MEGSLPLVLLSGGAQMIAWKTVPFHFEIVCRGHAPASRNKSRPGAGWGNGEPREIRDPNKIARHRPDSTGWARSLGARARHPGWHPGLWLAAEPAQLGIHPQKGRCHTKGQKGLSLGRRMCHQKWLSPLMPVK